jgi:hypothetical protein
MALERQAFVALVQHPKSQERILGMLSTGKPVRNSLPPSLWGGLGAYAMQQQSTPAAQHPPTAPAGMTDSEQTVALRGGSSANPPPASIGKLHRRFCVPWQN